jgi:hypothetical protein
MNKLQDMEQQLLRCWEITEDLLMVANEHEDDDEVSNKVIGLKHVYEMRFNKLWDLYEKTVTEYYAMRNELKEVGDGYRNPKHD